jgi:UDP-N-acetylmuramoylalanine--D-glutamate ligase
MGMKIAILGYGSQGRSAYEYWRQSGNEITVCDADESVELPKDVEKRLGGDYLKDLDSYDLIVRTPALHPREITQANPQAPDILEKVTSVTNEFFRVCPTKNIVGITGTKGKGTTSILIGTMLEAMGKRVHVGGNIGIPPLDMLKENIQSEDWVVLELANFQLIDLKYSPPMAICLMVEPEHQDWHNDIDEYIEAKRQLFKHQVEGDIAVYYADNNYSCTIAQASPGFLLPYMAKPGAIVTETGKFMIDGQEICTVDDVKLRGKHNWQNVCAAITAVWQIEQDVKALHRAISSFAGLPHRLELVREVDGVTYFNDSFASAPPATEAAIEAIEGQKVLIVGGHDRGLDLTQLARTIAAHQNQLRRLVIMGASGPRLEKALLAHGYRNYDLLKDKTMADIVAHARSCAEQGDSVVLSPGFASFDMFRNFEDRGQQYKDCVNAL